MFVLIIISLLSVAKSFANYGTKFEHYSEELLIRPLTSRQVLLTFHFKTFVATDWILPYGVNAGRHNDLFPLQLVKFLHQHDIHELHLSSASTGWNYDQWGQPPHHSTATGATHLWVCFTTCLNVEENWNKVNNHLAGQFKVQPFANTARPKWSSRATTEHHNYCFTATSSSGYSDKGREALIQLLPCTDRGLASLVPLNNLSRFTSYSLDFTFTCQNPADCLQSTGIELSQSVSLVLEQPDSQVNLKSLLVLNQTCPLSSSSRVLVQTSTKPEESHCYSLRSESIVYDLNRLFAKDIFVQCLDYPLDLQRSSSSSSSISIRKIVTQTTLFSGSITLLVGNNFESNLDIVYLDTTPTNLRPYLHTLQILSSNSPIKPQQVNFDPTMLEFSAQIPAKSITEISYQFELKCIHHGGDGGKLYLPPTIISISNGSVETVRIHSEPILLSLLTFDSNHPLPSIIIIITVLSLLFSTIYKLTTATISAAK